MSFPKEEVYGITSQMRRCSVSVPSNIAEGFGRSTLSFLNFLKIARGSLYELDTQLVLTRELELSANTELIDSLETEIQEIGKMINSFINKLKEKLQSNVELVLSGSLTTNHQPLITKKYGIKNNKHQPQDLASEKR